MQATARMARVFADETRLQILNALMEEGEATVSDLAFRLGLAQPRASSHLAVLRDAGLVEVNAAGRQRTYSVDADRVGGALTVLRGLAAPQPSKFAPSAHAAREIRRNSPVRQARTCYDHIAGVAGVQLLEAMVERGWLTPEGARPVYMLTLEGGRALAERGVEVSPTSRRTFAFGCLDWTERRPHLGGALGAAILRALLAAGVVRRTKGSRAVQIARPLGEWLDGPAVASSPAADEG